MEWRVITTDSDYYDGGTTTYRETPVSLCKYGIADEQSACWGVL